MLVNNDGFEDQLAKKKSASSLLCVYTHIYIFTYVWIDICTDMYIYIYIYTYIHMSQVVSWNLHIHCHRRSKHLVLGFLHSSPEADPVPIRSPQHSIPPFYDPKISVNPPKPLKTVCSSTPNSRRKQSQERLFVKILSSWGTSICASVERGNLDNRFLLARSSSNDQGKLFAIHFQSISHMAIHKKKPLRSSFLSIFDLCFSSPCPPRNHDRGWNHMVWQGLWMLQ